MPLGTAAVAPDGAIAVWVTGATLLARAGPGAVGARAGGAGMRRGTQRVRVWGAMAMAATAAVGHMFAVAAA